MIEFRWADSVDQLPQLAAELVRMNVDVIFAQSSTHVEAARRATKTIPIIFSNNADPIGTGQVASLARPGGNITGLSLLMTELGPKQLEILKEVLPQSKHLAVVWNPTTPSHKPALPVAEAAGIKLGLKLTFVPVRTPQDFEPAMEVMTREQIRGFVVLGSPAQYSEQGARMAALALNYRLAGMFAFKENVQAGGLMCYFPDVIDLNRRSAAYIVKIFKGAKPADLPVEQATKFEMVINLKTAKALGLSIPPTVLAMATDVIE